MLLWWGWVVLQAVVMVVCSSGMVHLVAVAREVAMVACSSAAASRSSFVTFLHAVFRYTCSLWAVVTNTDRQGSAI
jgi:hypothetical protein